MSEDIRSCLASEGQGRSGRAWGVRPGLRGVRPGYPQLLAVVPAGGGHLHTYIGSACAGDVATEDILRVALVGAGLRISSAAGGVRGKSEDILSCWRWPAEVKDILSSWRWPERAEDILAGGGRGKSEHILSCWRWPRISRGYPELLAVAKEGPQIFLVAGGGWKSSATGDAKCKRALDPQSPRASLVDGLPGRRVSQVLKLSLLSRECSGEGVHADLHMSCKLY